MHIYRKHSVTGEYDDGVKIPDQPDYPQCYDLSVYDSQYIQNEIVAVTGWTNASTLLKLSKTPIIGSLSGTLKYAGYFQVDFVELPDGQIISINPAIHIIRNGNSVLVNLNKNTNVELIVSYVI